MKGVIGGGKKIAGPRYPDQTTGALEISTGVTVSCVSRAGRGSHTGYVNSGIGFARNTLRVCRAVHRAHAFAFLRRALSVEIPVPAYICRYSFDNSTNDTRARRVGVHEDLFHTALRV